MPYAQRPDMYQLSVQAAAFGTIATADQDVALEAASRVADSYLTRRFTLPLLLWGDDLRQAVCDIAAYRLIRARGFNPAKGGADAEELRNGYKDAIKWLEGVADNKIVATGIQDSSQGGTNDTDAPGDQAPKGPNVLSPLSSTSTPRSFWDKGSCQPGGVGPPRRRGW